MDEEAVGITQFANDQPRFSAVLKHRYADFIVREIPVGAGPVQLTSLAALEQTTQVKTGGGGRDTQDLVQACSTQLAELEKLAGAGNRAKLEDLLKRMQVRGHSQHQSVMLEPMRDKALRSAVHNFFKQGPPLPQLETTTVLDPNNTDASNPSSVICVEQRKGRGRKRGRGAQADAAGSARKQHIRETWPGGGSNFCRFVLGKCNMDTQAAISLLAQKLRCPQHVLATAGTKDKRAVTFQQVTGHMVSSKRLAGLNKGLRGCKVGNFEYVGAGLNLGQQLGNEFEIVLRKLTGATAEQVQAAADGLKASGFINYYGLQRFGSNDSATHRVGKHLVLGQWEDAVKAIMMPHAGEREDAQAARRLYLDKGDISGALRGMPQFLQAERAVLQGLQRKRQDFVGALQGIPRNTRNLYVHAVQSYVWNLAVSRRIQHFGCSRVVAGDLVLKDADQLEAAGKFNDCAMAAAVSASERSSGRLAAVHEVTPEEAEAGTFSIEQVVLPLPGKSTRTPGHAVAEVYKKAASTMGISLDSCSHQVREFSLMQLSGDYRRMLQKPNGFEARVIPYQHPDEELATTELSKWEDEAGTSRAATLAAGSDQAAAADEAGQQPASQAQQGPAQGGDGQASHGTAEQPVSGPPASDSAAGAGLLALSLKFQLPPSCYATMLIRELTKNCTSKAHHKALTQVV
eukprot:jgi/Astpho2/3047/e_gw1.00051.10.1_t